MPSALKEQRSLAGGPRTSTGGQYLNISEAAAWLGVSRVSIWRWMRDGALPAARLGHRTVRIRREDVERLLAAGRPTGVRSWVGQELRQNGPASARRTEHVPQPDGPNWHVVADGEHLVQLYETDGFLLDAVAEFAGAALLEGNAGIVIATPAHRAGVEERLRARGIDPAGAAAQDRYLPLDAAATLRAVMDGGVPDAGRFRATIGGMLRRAGAGGRRVRAFGEMVALLVDEGNPAAAIRLERLWNELLQTHAFSLFCAYPIDYFTGESLGTLLGDVCAVHSRAIPAESYTALSDADDRLRTVVQLQQRARSLEAEIAERRGTEARLRAALAERDDLLVAQATARETAEAALRLRDEFLSIAAHELKTPLTSLYGHAQLALRRFERQGSLEPEHVVGALQTIAGQSRRLTRLLGQLLDVTRLENGRLMLDRQPTDLCALVEGAVAAASARSDRHVITLEAPAALEASVDPLRLEQVLTNLLENAIKFSPDGTPVEVALVPLGGDMPAVELTVRDHGIGIPIEMREHLFERFHRAHANGHRSGMGVGLYVSRQIVELHRGEIRVEFPPDGGTRFVVRLPLQPEVAP
jgi:excisionase family DNA binding protein